MMYVWAYMRALFCMWKFIEMCEYAQKTYLQTSPTHKWHTGDEYDSA